MSGLAQSHWNSHPGTLLGIAEKVVGFLSLSDLLAYIQVAATASHEEALGGAASVGTKRKASSTGSSGDDAAGSVAETVRASRLGFSRKQKHRREYELQRQSVPSGTGAGDEAGGFLYREPPPSACGGGMFQDQGFLSSILYQSLRVPIASAKLAGGIWSMVLDKISVLSLIQWGYGRVKAAGWFSVQVACLPYYTGKYIITYILATIEQLLGICYDVWCDMRHVGMREMLCVMWCLLRGQSLPPDYCGAQHKGAAESSQPPSRASSLDSEDSEASVLSGLSQGMGAIVGVRDTELLEAIRINNAETRRRLDRINRTAPLVSYEEKGRSAMSRSQAERVKRMMHYDISLRGFQAQVRVTEGSPSTDALPGSDGEEDRQRPPAPMQPFMCTPQSFPPTPNSRAHVMARTSRYSDDILFLARDQLRLDQHSKCPDETTRLTAEFLKRQTRLAVLNAHDAADGIVLTCGQHVATRDPKIRGPVYGSVRAMVPVLRNRYVFFQLSISADQGVSIFLTAGLSTLSMPLNTMVGAWDYSIGLASNGKLFKASTGHDCPGEARFRTNSVVGVLVYLDGAHIYQSWEGEIVSALVGFSVDGRPVHVNTGTPLTAMTAAKETAAEAKAGTEQGQNLSPDKPVNTTAIPLPKDTDLFPTVTIVSMNTQVFARFGAADIVDASRASMGAPPNVPVYALDGSIILKANCDCACAASPCKHSTAAVEAACGLVAGQGP